MAANIVDFVAVLEAVAEERVIRAGVIAADALVLFLVTRLDPVAEEPVLKTGISGVAANVIDLVAVLEAVAEESVIRAGVSSIHALVQRLIARLDSVAEQAVEARISGGRALVQLLIARLDACAEEAVVGARSRPGQAGTIEAIFLSIAEQFIVAAGRCGGLLIDPVRAVIVHSVANLVGIGVYFRIRVVAVSAAAGRIVIPVAVQVPAGRQSGRGRSCRGSGGSGRQCRGSGRQCCRGWRKRRSRWR